MFRCIIILAFFGVSPALSAVHTGRAHSCSAGELACGDGACVSQDGRCDGARDCADGSDEQFCAPSSPASEGCRLPDYPEHGFYAVSYKPNAKPGEVYDMVSLDVTCEPGYGVDGSQNSHCIQGKWLTPMPQCTRHCKLTPHPSITYYCQETDIISGIRICGEFEPSGTVVQPECNRPNYYYPGVLNYMRCIDGSWDSVTICQPGSPNVTIIVNNEVYIIATDTDNTVSLVDLLYSIYTVDSDIITIDAPVKVPTDRSVRKTTNTAVTITINSPLTITIPGAVTFRTTAAVTLTINAPVTVTTNGPVTFTTTAAVTMTINAPVTVTANGAVTLTSTAAVTITTSAQVTLTTNRPVTVTTSGAVTSTISGQVTVTTNATARVATTGPVTLTLNALIRVITNGYLSVTSNPRPTITANVPWIVT